MSKCLVVVRRLCRVAKRLALLTILTKLFTTLLSLGLSGFELLALFGCEDSEDLFVDRLPFCTHLGTERSDLLALFSGYLTAVAACIAHRLQFRSLRLTRLVGFVDLTDLFFLRVGQRDTSKTETHTRATPAALSATHTAMFTAAMLALHLLAAIVLGLGSILSRSDHGEGCYSNAKCNCGREFTF